MQIKNKAQHLFSELVSAWSCVLVMVLFLAAQYYKLCYLAPPPEYIWDNVYLWDWARNFSLGNFAPFVPDSHHQLRWANWGFAAVLIQFFSDQVLYYYLATAIPSILAGLLFIYFAWKYIGVWQAAILALLWFYDSELFRATFQLLPTGQSLLPIAILLILVTRVVKSAEIKTSMAVLISLCVFWLYGVKETYLAFAPAIAWLMWQIGGFRALRVLLLVMAVGYFAETVFFRLISSDFSLYGRLYTLVNGGQHVTIMLENDHYVGQQTRYFDSGITMRWIAAVGVSSVTYFSAFLFSILVMAQRYKERVNGLRGSEYKAHEVVTLFLLSFMFFTTFFVISVSPLRLGHGLVSRYLAISLPFCYLLILSYMTEQLRETSYKFKLAAMIVIPFLIAPAINRFGDYPEQGIMKISKSYALFGDAFREYDCVQARQKSIVRNHIEMIPLDHRGPLTQAMIANKNIEPANGLFLVKGSASECKNTYTINRIETARY